MPVAKVIRDDDEISFCVQKLPLAKEFAGKFLAEEVTAAAGSAVQNHDRIVDNPPSIVRGFAECAAMHPDFWQ